MDKPICYDDFFAMLRQRLGEREFRLASSALAITLPRGGISLVVNDNYTFPLATITLPCLGGL